MKYELIHDWRLDVFEKAVNRALEKGAQLVGGGSITTDLNNTQTYSQAVIHPNA